MGDNNKMDKTRALNRYQLQKDKAKEARWLSQWLLGELNRRNRRDISCFQKLENSWMFAIAIISYLGVHMR